MTAETGPKKTGSKLAVISGLLAALCLGGGGFYAVYGGYVLAPEGEQDAADHATPPKELPPLAFIPIPSVMVSLAQGNPEKILRFEGNLEVDPAYRAEVENLMPRVMDVMNSYLRAVELQDLEDPSALLRLRAQMLRRVQIVTGEGRVRDLLVSTFLIS